MRPAFARFPWIAALPSPTLKRRVCDSARFFHNYAQEEVFMAIEEDSFSASAPATVALETARQQALGVGVSGTNWVCLAPVPLARALSTIHSIRI